MKKLLLATAAIALIAPAAQAEVKLDLGGYFKGYAGMSSQDNAPGTRDFDFKRKSQIFFTGETTLDNGLTVGYNGQLMQDTGNENANGAAAQVEQSYLYFSGNWGRVNMGKENGAGYLLQVAAPGADANLDGMDVDFSFFNGAGSARQDYGHMGAGQAAAGRGEEQQYADKVTYLTPKFNGFQAGVSYTPEVEVRDTTTYFGMSAANDGDLENLMEAGLRYDGEMSGVGLHLGGAYTTADREANGAAGTDDYKEWTLGAKVNFDAFGIGAAYNDRDAGIALTNDVQTWTAGADYTWGAYTFGVSYLDSQADLTAGGEDNYDRWTAGASYTFGPGMKFNGSVALHDADLAAAGADNEATVVAVGTDIQF